MDSLQKAMVLFSALVLMSFGAVLVQAVEPWAVTDWNDAHATFYGGNDASGTMGGACGYGNLYALGYGTSTTALSNGLFNHGLSCGACYKIICKMEETTWCYSGGRSITVTATNACPPGSEGGWCDPPRLHFDLSYPMFQELAQPIGGVIPVKYRRVPCSRQGGVRVSLYGNPWFNYVLIHNVAGGGDVAAVAIKGEKLDWCQMTQNWGQFWSANQYVMGQAISFRVTLGNGQSLEFKNLAPADWTFGQTYETDQNFW